MDDLTSSHKGCRRYDQRDYKVTDQMDLPPFYGLDKTSTIDSMIDNVNFESLLSGNASSDVLLPCDDFVNCESFPTKYPNVSSGINTSMGINSLNYNMDSLTESMLKQLDTPKLSPQLDDVSPDFSKLNSLCPQMLQRLSDAGIDMSTVSYSDIFNEDVIRGGNRNRMLGQISDSFNFNNVLSRGVSGVGMGAGMRKKELPYKMPVSSNRRGPRGRRINMSDDSKPIMNKNVSFPVSNRMRGGKNNFSTSSVSSPLGSANFIKDVDFNHQIAGNVLSIAQDQTGCRMLQRQLDCNDEEFISSILDEVVDNMSVLMTDPFGNYLCQKLMVVCSVDQLSRMIAATEKDFISICMNIHGTRAIQKLIDVVSKPEHVSVITGILSDVVVDLINDLNGNHVIQKCLMSFSNENCDFIYKAMNENCVYLATHRHGCCVMQRCIDAANPEQRHVLVDTISFNTLALVEDAYGNYVIQYVLRLKDDEINRRIVTALADNVTELAKQKFSSNVVERCLIFCPLEIRSILISKFLSVPFDVLKDLILDPFGNYVIQRVLNVAHSDELTKLLDRIQPHLEELKVASAGKRIAAKISRRQYSNDEDTLLTKRYEDLSNLLCGTKMNTADVCTSIGSPKQKHYSNDVYAPLTKQENAYNSNSPYDPDGKAFKYPHNENLEAYFNNTDCPMPCPVFGTRQYNSILKKNMWLS